MPHDPQPKDCNEAIEAFLVGKLPSPSLRYRFSQYRWHTKAIAVITSPFWLGIYGISRLTSWQYNPVRTPQLHVQTRQLLYYLSTLPIAESNSLDDLADNDNSKLILSLIYNEFTQALRDNQLRIGRYISNQEKEHIANKLQETLSTGTIEELETLEPNQEKSAQQAYVYALKKYKSSSAYIPFMLGKTLAFICALAAAIATFGYAIYIMPGLAIGYSIGLVCSMISAYITFKMYHHEMPDVISKFTLFSINTYLRKTTSDSKTALIKENYSSKQKIVRAISSVPILISSTFAAVMTYQGLLHSLVILGPMLGPVAMLLAGVTFIGTIILSFNSYTEAIEQGFGFWETEKAAFLGKSDTFRTSANQRQKKIIFFTTLTFFALIVVLGNILSDVLSALRLEHKLTWIPKYLASIGMTSINAVAMLAFVVKSSAKAASVLSQEIFNLLDSLALMHDSNNPAYLYFFIPIASCIGALAVLAIAIVNSLLYPLKRAVELLQNSDSSESNDKIMEVTSAWDKCATAVHNIIKGISRMGQILEAELAAGVMHDGFSFNALFGGIWTILKSNISFARIIYKPKATGQKAPDVDFSDANRDLFRDNELSTSAQKNSFCDGKPGITNQDHIYSPFPTPTPTQTTLKQTP